MNERMKPENAAKVVASLDSASRNQASRMTPI